MHADRIPDLVPEYFEPQLGQLTQQMGWVFVVSLFLRAYSLGGGNIHRDRSSIQQRSVTRRTPRSHRQMDDVLYGGVAKLCGLVALSCSIFSGTCSL